MRNREVKGVDVKNGNDIYGEALGLNTLCRGCFSYMTFIGLGLNLLKKSECLALAQIVLCIFFIFRLIIFRVII